MAQPTPNNFNLINLDFDTLKAQLLASLKNNPVFTDYNFEGDPLNIIVDILTRNTVYNAALLQLSTSEAFLDSAQLRQNVVSIASQLNYVPVSRKAPKAVINISVTPGIQNPPATIFIPKFTQFTTTANGKNYTFVTVQSYSADLNVLSNSYSFSGVEIFEGVGYTYQYIVDPSAPGQRFVIPNPNADISLMTVRLQLSSLNTSVTALQPTTEVNELTPTSMVYFLREAEDMLYELQFGDGVLGFKPQDGNVILIDYVVTNGASANYASSFVNASPIGGFSNVLVTTAEGAFGGAERESVQSIKFAAPRNYEAQNRAVTNSDYKTLLLREFPQADSISVARGEDMTPPQYGKVFVALKPKEGYIITQAQKDDIVNSILKQYNVVTVIPEIVDPVYIFVELTSRIKFNPTLTNATADTIKQIVQSTIQSYADTHIAKFDENLFFTQLTTDINYAEPSIISNVTTIRLQQRLQPHLNQLDNYELNFTANNNLVPGSVSSTQFIVAHDPTFPYIQGDIHGFSDDGKGNLQIYKQIGVQRTVMKTKAGTVDYDNGIIRITEFIPSQIIDGQPYIKISATPASTDVLASGIYIIDIDPLDVDVQMVMFTPQR